MADTADRPDTRAAAAPAGPRPSLRRISRRFVRLPNGRRMLLLQAVLWLAVSRIALLFVPFRLLAARFGTATSPSTDALAAQPVLPEDQADLAREVGWAVTRAARYVPFRAVCLPQAIAAQAMLRRRRIASTMHFGVAKKPGADMEAHAWLDAGRIEVTGYPVASEFVEVARFL